MCLAGPRFFRAGPPPSAWPLICAFRPDYRCLAAEPSYQPNLCSRNSGPRAARPRAVVACLGKGVPSVGSDNPRLGPMTATPADGPGVPADEAATLHLSRLIKRPVTDRGGGSLGRLADVIVRLRGADYPLVTGLVAVVGGREIFVPIDQVSSFDGDPLRLSSARLSLRHFERRDGEVLLRADVLGHRLIDVPNARLVRAADLELARDRADWVLTGVDPRPRRMFGLLAPEAPAGRVGCRDWSDFEWLIG